MNVSSIQPSAALAQVTLRIALASNDSKLFGSVKFNGREIAFTTALYAYVGAPLSIGLWCTGPDADDCGPYGDLTKARTRGMQVDLADNEVLVKTYNENDFLREPLLASGYFEDTLRRQEVGFVELEVWRITDKFVREFAAANPQFHQLAAA